MDDARLIVAFDVAVLGGMVAQRLGLPVLMNLGVEHSIGHRLKGRRMALVAAEAMPEGCSIG